MKFTFVVEATPEDRPDMVGEYLRDQFFDQDKGFGCYETFDIREGVERLPDESIDADYDLDGIKFRVFRKIVSNQWVIMRYFWDGDGELVFEFKDGSYIVNSDCKKDYGWQYYGVD